MVGVYHIGKVNMESFWYTVVIQQLIETGGFTSQFLGEIP